MTVVVALSRPVRASLHRNASAHPVESANYVPSRRQLAWLRRGIGAPGGKLPLFTSDGQDVPRGVIEGAIAAGWAEPWFSNPIKPDWLVCRLTPSGHALFARERRD
jgi:hypothetical protein